MSDEKTITIVLGQKGENITTKQIFIMDELNTITHTPVGDEIIMVEKDGAYTKTGNIPTEFKVSKNLTAVVIHKVAGKVEEVDNAVNRTTEDKKKEEVDALNQQQINPELIAEQNTASNPGPEPTRTGDNSVGGYRVTRRRRNPRRKQKKSYRRRRV